MSRTATAPRLHGAGASIRAEAHSHDERSCWILFLGLKYKRLPQESYWNRRTRAHPHILARLKPIHKAEQASLSHWLPFHQSSQDHSISGSYIYAAWTSQYFVTTFLVTRGSPSRQQDSAEVLTRYMRPQSQDRYIMLIQR
jgi:hypothetical protein